MPNAIKSFEDNLSILSRYVNVTSQIKWFNNTRVEQIKLSTKDSKKNERIKSFYLKNVYMSQRKREGEMQFTCHNNNKKINKITKAATLVAPLINPPLRHYEFAWKWMKGRGETKRRGIRWVGLNFWWLAVWSSRLLFFLTVWLESGMLTSRKLSDICTYHQQTTLLQVLEHN